MLILVRRTFFSFHYARDIWRANVIRNCWYGRDREAAGFWDSSLWEKRKDRIESAIKDKISEGLNDTAVTIVLIGKYTSERRWVLYEISESIHRKNGLLGIFIHNIKNRYGEIDLQGENPFSKFYVNKGGRRVYFSEFIPTYYWKRDNGYYNLRYWIEKAVKKRDINKKNYIVKNKINSHNTCKFNKVQVFPSQIYHTILTCKTYLPAFLAAVSTQLAKF